MQSVQEIVSDMIAAYWLSGINCAMNVYDAVDYRLQPSVSRTIENDAVEGTVEEKIFEELCSR